MNTLEITLGGQTYALPEKLSVSQVEDLQELVRGQVRKDFDRQVIAVALRKHHKEMTSERIADLPTDQNELAQASLRVLEFGGWKMKAAQEKPSGEAIAGT